MSNNSIDIKIQAFCNLFNEFLDDLSRMYPNDMSLKMLKNACSIMIMTNNKSFIFQVMNIISPYSEKILARDEEFFKTTFKDDLEDSYILQEFHKVHDIWVNPDTTKNTKECIWECY